jgi:hypothetical protein
MTPTGCPPEAFGRKGSLLPLDATRPRRLRSLRFRAYQTNQRFFTLLVIFWRRPLARWLTILPALTLPGFIDATRIRSVAGRPGECTAFVTI